MNPNPMNQQFEMLMNQLMQTSNAAIRAAEAANALMTSSSTSTSSSGNGSSKELYKLISKPSVFAPENKEQEISQWKDWFWSIRQYLAVVDSAYESDVSLLLRDLDTPVLHDELDDAKKDRSRFLYSFLSSLVKGRPLTILKNIGECNGLEVLRNLVQTFQPSSKTRSLAIMNTIMGWKEFDMRQPLLPQILKLEEAFLELARVSDPLPENLKLAVLSRCITGQLKTYINVHLDEGASFDAMREAVLRFDRATTKWTSTTGLGQDDPTPMEVDRIKGKEKGKKGKNGKDGKGKQGKSKGYGKDFNSSFQQSKGKGKEQKGKGYGYDNKGKGKSDDLKGWKGKGKYNSPGKSAGRGKGYGWNQHGSQQNWNYGNNTWYRDDRVRQVEESGPIVHGSQVSAGTSASQAASSSGETQTQKTVRFICEPNASSSTSTSNPIIFDLTGSSHGSGHVRAIHSDVSSNVAAIALDDRHGVCSCEYFDMSGDSDCEHVPDDLRVVDLRSKMEYVRMVQISELDDDAVEIVIDSGSDASVIPFSMVHVGDEVSQESQSVLYDAQGNVMEGAGERKIEIVLQGETVDQFDASLKTTPILFREQAHVGPVSNPILCYGRLLENDWGIENISGEPFLKHASGVQVPLHYKGRSLAVSGKVRQIEQVKTEKSIRAIQIQVPPVRFTSCPLGWSSLGDLRVCHTMQKTVVNPQDDEVALTFPFRTTLMKFDVGWKVHELSEDWRQAERERTAQTLSGKYRECLTIMSKTSMSLTSLGLRLFSEGDASQEVPGSNFGALPTSETAQESADRHVPPEPEVQADFEFGREDRVPSELQGFSNLEGRYHAVEVPVRLEEVQEDGSFLIEGVVVTLDSTCKVLKAACSHLGLSQSGGKAKLFGKIQAHFDQKRIELTREAAMKARDMDERSAETIPLMEPPSQDEIERHLLSHLPYAGWCSSCVMARGRQDSHKLAETHRVQREHPTVSMDFAYTGYGDGSLHGGKVESSDDKEKLCCLVLHCSETGSVHAIPVDQKKNLAFLTGEIVRYIAWLGHGTCIVRCDQEPVLLKLQKLVMDARLKVELKTIRENPPIQAHASNGLVENSVQRIRNMSNTLLHYLREKTGLKFDAKHSLTAWSWSHAAWLLNRYQPNHGRTSYELLTGHGYNGKIALYGEPVLAFTYVPGKPKGIAKWTRGVSLGKSMLNDMHIIATPERIFLTRAIRRNMSDWADATDLYVKFDIHPWRIAGMMGVKSIPDLKAVRIGAEAAPAL